MTIRENIRKLFNSFAEFCVNVLRVIQGPIPLTIQRGHGESNWSLSIQDKIKRGNILLEWIREKKVLPGKVDKLKAVKVKCQKENKDYDWDMHMDEMETLIKEKQDKDSLICPITQRPFIDPVVTQTTCENSKTVKRTYEREALEKWLSEGKLDPLNRQRIIGKPEPDTETRGRLNEIIGEANKGANKSATPKNTQSFWRIWFGSSTPHQAEESSGVCQTSALTKEEESEEQKKERLLKKLCTVGTLSSEESSWLERQDLGGNGGTPSL